MASLSRSAGRPHNPARRFATGALVALLLGTSACKPTMELHSARFAGASPGGVAFEMMVKVRNKNAFDVAVRNVRADVVLAERYRLPPIRYDPNQWLAAGQVSYVRVPMVVPWPLIAPLVATTARSTTISYQASCVADVTATRAFGVEVEDFELAEEGAVSRAELVAAAARGTGILR